MGQANQSMPLFFYIITFTKFCGTIALLVSNTAIFDHHKLLMFHFIIRHLNVLKYGLRFFICFLFVSFLLSFLFYLLVFFLLSFSQLFSSLLSFHFKERSRKLSDKMNITVVTIGNGPSFQDQSQRDVK